MKGYKTLIFNGVVIIAAGVLFFTGALDADTVTLIVGTALANMGLRSITDTPMGSPTPKPTDPPAPIDGT